MRNPGRVARGVALVSSALIGLTACSQHIGVGTPLAASSSAAALVATCRAADPLTSTLSGLVGVDPDPTSVLAIWWSLGQSPGQPACRSWHRAGDATVATALARDVRRAPAFPSGTINCPSGPEIGAHLYFGFAHRSDEYVQVDVSTCGDIGAPHRQIRTLSPQLSNDLVPLAPPTLVAALRRS